MNHKLHWLCWQPTPYNDYLFMALSKDPDIDLTVHFRDRLLASHPWKTEMARDYRTQFYKCVFGIDWHVVSLPFREKSSFFIVGGWDHPTAIVLINILSLLGKRFAIWTDTPDLNRKRNPIVTFLRAHWLKWVFRKASKILATGRPAIAALQDMGAAEERLVVFPYWVDLEYYASSKPAIGLNQKHPRICFISSGRLNNRVKGHDIAIMALGEVARKTNIAFDYFIAGEGEDGEKLKRLAHQKGIGNRVTFLGWIEPDEMLKHLSYADVLIHPSPIHEPYGVAVIEAMASGCVVLASDVTCAALDRIDHGVNGFIHPAGNWQILADQIEFLLKNPENLLTIGSRARKTAELWPVERGIKIIKYNLCAELLV